MRTAPPFRSARSCAVLAILVAISGTALAMTNPGPEEFEGFAADQLVELAVDEVCRGRLPMPLQLVLQNCPELIRNQRKVLGALALQNTRRENFGVFSLYRTEIGGASVLPLLDLPRYRVLTLAGAGRFRILSTSSDRSEERSGGQASTSW